MSEKDKNTNNEESTLFSAPEKKGISYDAGRRAAQKQRRDKLTIIFVAAAAVAVAALICLYTWVLRPQLTKAPEDTAETVALLEGESLAQGNRILMYDHYERADISEIEVNNEHGTFSFYYDEKEEQFFVKGQEAAPFDSEKFSYLVVGAGYGYAIERAEDRCESFSEYGLAEEQNPAWYRVTAKNGDTHKVYVGYMTHDGEGYFAKHENRDALYIIPASSGNAMLCSLENMITPLLVLPMNQNDYLMADNFTIFHGTEVSTLITHMSAEEKAAEAATTSYKLAYPAGYEINSNAYTEILGTLLNLQGSETLVYIPTDEELIKYGLSEPAYSLYYEYKDMEQLVVFSERNENGNFYAYSGLFNLITEVDGETMDFITWDLVKWVDEPIFMMNINDVASLTFESDTATRVFELSGDGKELAVTERSSGVNISDIQNFREFYKLLLSVPMQDYISADLTDTQTEELASEKPYLTMTVKTEAGKERIYRFYPYHYSDRRSYYTVNGNGAFYVLTDRVTKIITDAEKVILGEKVDSTANS